MLKDYVPDDVGKDINERNVASYSNHNFSDWINLTGLQLASLPANFTTVHDFSLTGTYPTIRLVANNTNVFLDMRCNLEDKSLYFSWFILTQTHTGRGPTIFRQMIDAAYKIGISVIRCQAKNGKTPLGKELYGSKAWAKMGFTMTAAAHQDFLALMRQHGRNETCLQKLLLTQDGSEFWEVHIKKWAAQFDPEKHSVNNRLFEIFRQRKLIQEK